MKEGMISSTLGTNDSSTYTYKEMRFLFNNSPVTAIKQFPLNIVNIILLLADNLMDATESELFLYSYPKRFFYNLLYNHIEQASKLALIDQEQLQALSVDVGRLFMEGNDKLKRTYDRNSSKANTEYANETINSVDDSVFNLNLLWASLVRRVFNNGEFLSPSQMHNDIRLLICMDNLTHGFQSILNDFHENDDSARHKEKEKENGKESSTSQYDYSGIEANKLQHVLISFIGQLCKCGFVDTAQAIHNYIYLTGKVTRDGTAMNNQKALERVLRSLFYKKLNLKGRILVSSTFEEAHYPWELYTKAELCEMSFFEAVYRACVKMALFCQPFHANHYIDACQESFAEDFQEKLDFLLPPPLQLTSSSNSSEILRHATRSTTKRSLIDVFDIQGSLCLSFLVRGLKQSFPKNILSQDAPSKHDFDGIDKQMIQRAMTLCIAQLIKCGNLNAAQGIHDILQKKNHDIEKVAIRLFHHALKLKGCILTGHQKKKSDKKHKGSDAQHFELGFFMAVCKALLEMPQFRDDFKIEDYESHYQYSFDADLQLFRKKFKSHSPIKLNLGEGNLKKSQISSIMILLSLFKNWDGHLH